MKVLVDATTLSGASAFRGIGTYLRNVMEALGATGEVDLFALENGDSGLHDLATCLPVRRIAWARYPDLDQRFLLPRDIDRVVRRHGIDVFHAPASDLPASSRIPVVATLHDAVPLVLPGYEWEKRRWQLQAPRFRAASAVIAVSQHSSQEGQDVLGLSPERITVAHHGVPTRFTDNPRLPPEDFLLFVSEFDPRKRPELALKVLDEVIALGHPAELVITGRIDPHSRPRWNAMLDACVNSEHVKERGFVSEEALLRLLGTARAMLITSVHEGFGLPALEAMAGGTPVVAFANTATAEVIAEGGLLVDEADVGAYARAVSSLYNSTTWAAASERARKRAATFSWARSAERHLSAYREALQRP